MSCLALRVVKQTPGVSVEVEWLDEELEVVRVSLHGDQVVVSIEVVHGSE